MGSLQDKAQGIGKVVQGKLTGKKSKQMEGAAQAFRGEVKGHVENAKLKRELKNARQRHP